MVAQNSWRKVRTRRPGHSGTTFRALEVLESRVLLSAAHVATHDFVIQHHTRTSPAAAFAPNGLTPALVRQAYGINQVMFGNITGDGSGQTIAIVDAYNAPTIVSDLHAFDLLYGLPDPTLIRINQNGGTTLPGNDPAGRGNSWAIETSLDVEWAHAIAPKATILLVLANSNSNANLMAAVNTARRYAGVSAVSMSWGGNEYSADSSYNSYFTTPSGHNGVTFFAASGDSGAYGSTGTRTVGYPAASPNVVSVGGTRLTIDSSGNYLSESAWGNGSSSYSLGGSGGGISRYQSQPSYQRGVVTQSTSFRALPDVSFLADPSTGVAVIDSWDFGNTTPVPIGGTSLAAPMWAGVIAMANQGRALAGLGTLDGATQTLPRLYALPSSDFHDITTGNNGYAAGPGFDLVTGRGTPIVNRLVPDLVSATTPAPSPGTPSIGSFAVSPNSVTSGATVNLTASNVSESGGTITAVNFYRESNGQSGLQTGSDTLIGTGLKNGTTWTITTSTAGLGGGATYYAVAKNAANVSSSVAQAALTINAPASSNDNFANGKLLTGTTTAGSNVNATKEPGEPNHAGYVGGHSVWYTWTAPSTGTVYFETRGSNFDTLLAVYKGSSVSALTLVVSNDDVSTYDRTSRLSFNATAGTTYRIAVDGYNGAQGSISLNLQQLLRPVNDYFANAATLTGNQWTGTNLYATRESGEPSLAGNTGGVSVWVNWIAPATGIVNLSTAGSTFDTVLGVYTGTAVSALTLVASNDDVSTYDHSSRLAFNATAGTTYHLRLDGYNAAQGSIVMTVI